MEKAYRGHNSTLRCCRLLSAHQSFPLSGHIPPIVGVECGIQCVSWKLIPFFIREV